MHTGIFIGKIILNTSQWLQTSSYRHFGTLTCYMKGILKRPAWRSAGQKEEDYKGELTSCLYMSWQMIKNPNHLWPIHIVIWTEVVIHRCWNITNLRILAGRGSGSGTLLWKWHLVDCKSPESMGEFSTYKSFILVRFSRILLSCISTEKG